MRSAWRAHVSTAVHTVLVCGARMEGCDILHGQHKEACSILTIFLHSVRRLST